MLLSFHEQIVENFIIPSFTIKKGEIVIIEIPGGMKFQEITSKLIDIITEQNSSFKYADHIKENSFLYYLYPLTIQRYLKYCGEDLNYKDKIYEIDWISPKIKIRILNGSIRRLLALYKTLTFTKNVLLDLGGVDPAGGIKIYEILKNNQKENGAIILFDNNDEFQNDCSQFIKIKSCYLNI